jgi:putative glycerol-1-phosphate prenyltransferase
MSMGGGGKTILPTAWKQWRHAVKLDPDRPIAQEVLCEIGQTGTDVILIGGTQGITYEKSLRLLSSIREAIPHLPVWQEVSESHAILPEVDGYGIPVVLNAGSTEWLVGRHVQAIARFGSLIPWEKVVVEGYLVLNGDAAVAQVTGAKTGLSPEEAAAYAEAGERLFQMQTLYIEYSGRYGDARTVQAIRRATVAHLVYGGGIDSYEKAAEMGEWADTIVVGNALYERGIEVVYETVRAVK